MLKITIDSGKFEAVVDCIRDEGEYRIKLRTFDAYGESEDSNIVVARFRRQDSNPSGANMIQRTQSDQTVDIISQNLLRQTQSQENLISVPTAEIKPPVIMNKRLEVNQSMSSGGFPLLLQQKQNESPKTPDKNQVNLEGDF